jgi:U3 small nucleolar RNA-associated protein 3
MLLSRALLAGETLLDESGQPRAASRAILANKGLTPKRNKANRNPRVKKRLRYEKAQKKQRSMMPTYSEARASKAAGGSYEGEKSGIGRTVVKSRKLS